MSSFMTFLDEIWRGCWWGFLLVFVTYNTYDFINDPDIASPALMIFVGWQMRGAVVEWLREREELERKRNDHT